MLTVVSVYAPNSISEYPAFMDSLGWVLQKAPTEDSIVLLTDFNPRVGNNGDTWRGVIGWNSLSDLNSSSALILDFCADRGSSITNTMCKY